VQYQPGLAFRQAEQLSVANRTPSTTIRRAFDMATHTMTPADGYDDKGNLNEVEDRVSDL
jgi:hypothetical protein